MTRTQYLRQVMALLRKTQERPKQAPKGLLALSKKVAKLARLRVSEQDARECVGFAASSLLHAGLLNEGAKVEQQLIEVLRADMRGIQFSLANSTGTVARAFFKLRRREGGKETGGGITFFVRKISSSKIFGPRAEI